MKIGKKLFLALLSLSLISLLLSTAVGLYQLAQTKKDVSEAQNNQATELTETNIQVLTTFNIDMLTALAENYSENLESKFAAITQQVLTVQSYLRGVYENGAETVSRLPDNMVYLQPGVSYEDVYKELQVIQSVRDLIASILETNPNILIYYVSKSGVLLGDRYVDYSAAEDIDRRERPWYAGAVAQRGVYWTPIYTDALTGGLTITCSAPVINATGDVLGVVGCDILLDPLINTVMAVHSDIIEYAFLTDNEGHDFVGSIENKSLTDFIGDKSERTALIQQMLDNTQSAGLYQNDSAMVGYAPVPITGWNVGAVINYQKVITPAQNMGEAIASANSAFHTYLDGKIRNAILISTAAAVVLLAIVLFVSRKITHSITNPLALLTEGVGFVSDGNLKHMIELHSGDELEQLAHAFNRMTGQLQEYISNLAKVTADRERIATELNVATQIQASMLPYIFPPFPGKKEFDIFATMLPAREVGGDFYDFFLIDENRLAVVIADVSGKGVPAALFMVIAKTLIKNNACLGKSPKEVFETVNNTLCENNEAGMFVTAFMGYFDMRDGSFVYVNAGHNPPLIKKAGGDYDFLKTKPCFILAGFDSIPYTETEVLLAPGDVLYLYTDGVTEAMNIDNELFSDQRLLSSINQYKHSTLKKLLAGVKKEIDDFADGAEQADDITMLALKVNKNI